MKNKDIPRFIEKTQKMCGQNHARAVGVFYSLIILKAELSKTKREICQKRTWKRGVCGEQKPSSY